MVQLVLDNITRIKDDLCPTSYNKFCMVTHINWYSSLLYPTFGNQRLHALVCRCTKGYKSFRILHLHCYCYPGLTMLCSPVEAMAGVTPAVFAGRYNSFNATLTGNWQPVPIAKHLKEGYGSDTVFCPFYGTINVVSVLRTLYHSDRSLMQISVLVLIFLILGSNSPLASER